MRLSSLILLAVSAGALAHGPVPGFRGHYVAPYIYGTTNNSLVGYGSSAQSYPITQIGPKEPDAEWTPMFHTPTPKPTVQGVPLTSMRGSAKGSYIYIAPGRKGTPEYQPSIPGVPPEGTIEWSKK